MAFGINFVTVPVNDVAHAIQLSLAPVFLLNGVGVLLAMLTTRLGRIIDRARAMEQRLATTAEDDVADLQLQLRTISRRARLINRAITLGTVTALLVAAVVALLFATAFLRFPLGAGIAFVFIASMLSLVGSLWCFLIEARISTASLRFGPSRRPLENNRSPS